MRQFIWVLDGIEYETSTAAAKVKGCSGQMFRNYAKRDISAKDCWCLNYRDRSLIVKTGQNRKFVRGKNKSLDESCIWIEDLSIADKRKLNDFFNSTEEISERKERKRNKLEKIRKDVFKFYQEEIKTKQDGQTK
jgi:hypothetical protein